jgi:hypothetical protein
MTRSRCPRCGHLWDYRGSSTLYVTCPGCYRKVLREDCTVYATLADEVEARIRDLASILGLPATAVTRRPGDAGEEVVVCLPPASTS